MASCLDCGWWAGHLAFSRFHCWRRSAASAPIEGEGCSDFWAAGSPLLAAPVEVEVSDPVEVSAPVGSGGGQLSLFGGES